MDTDYMEYRPKPVKKRDDAVDAFRYGVCALYVYMEKVHSDIQEQMHEQRLQQWEKRFNTLPMYKKNPALAEFQRSQIESGNPIIARQKKRFAVRPKINKKPLLSKLL